MRASEANVKCFKQVGETHERTEFLSKDRISVKGQIRLSVIRQIYSDSCKKHANKQNHILVHVENSFSERNLQLGESFRSWGCYNGAFSAEKNKHLTIFLFLLFWSLKYSKNGNIYFLVEI